MRAREIDRWSQSEQYRALVAANSQPSSAARGSLQQQQRGTAAQ
jgi:hypothetical protein